MFDRAISLINLQVSTCCVYVPLDLGPSFEMDLKKLQCSSYSGFYNLGPGLESHPENWNYGIALKYKFNVFDEYPVVCGGCERSNGACGFNTQTSSFVCNCPGGINTTSDCFFLYNSASILVPWLLSKYHSHTFTIYSQLINIEHYTSFFSIEFSDKNFYLFFLFKSRRVGNVPFVMGCCLDGDEPALKVLALVNSIGEHQRMGLVGRESLIKRSNINLLLLCITL